MTTTICPLPVETETHPLLSPKRDPEMAEQQPESEEAKAERAKEFLTNLNTPKSSRKRYSVAAPYAGYKQGSCSFVAS